MSNKCLFIYVGQQDMNYTLSSYRDYNIKREPQIGFAYLAAILINQGLDPEIIDFTITPYNQDQLTDYIIETTPIFVGFYAASAMKDRVIQYLKIIRQKFPQLKILVGGPDAYDHPNYLNAGADAYCIGEGEKTIIDLVAYCQDKLSRSQIKGIAYKENDKIYQTPPRELIDNLDELPIPAWDKFDLTKFYDYHVFDMKQPYTSIMASRGCPYRCTYCISHKIWQGKFRRRSPEHVLKEIDYLVLKHGVKYVTFQDDIWSWLDDNWVKKLCHSLIKRKYQFKWRCILHPFSFLKSRQEILPLMKAAGCTSITTGLQSASKVILKNIKRSPEEPAALAELIQVMKKNRILNNTEFIFGLPGETEATIEESIKYAIKIKPTFCAFYTLAILPGSDIWLMANQGQFQSLPADFLKKKCREAAKRFYTNPGVIFNLMTAIISRNPQWLWRAVKNLKYLFELAGMAKDKKRL